MSNLLTCPKCGMLTLRAGAVKCPGCKAWVGPLPRRPLTGPKLVLLLLGLSVPAMAVSALSSAVAASLWARGVSLPWPSRGRTAPAEDRAAPPASSATASASGEAGSALTAASSAPATGAQGAASLFAEPRAVRVSVGPVDAVIADDDAHLFVLGDDGSLRVVELASGKEVRKVLLPGRGSELRLLAGKYLGVLGAPGALPVVDLATFAVGRIELGGAAVDVVAFEKPPALVAATPGLRKVVRAALGTWKIEGQIVLPRVISGLVKLPPHVAREGGGERVAGAHEALAILTQGRVTGGLGAVEVVDPVAAPFGASRSTWITGVDLRPGAAGEASSFLVDRSAGQLVEISQDRPPRAVDVGQGPLGAYRLGDRWVVTVDTAGSASVFVGDTLEPRAPVPLGDIPADAAVTPDRRALLVALGGALGGSARDRGATTLVIAGDPPQVVGKLSTGPGSRRVRVSKSGHFAAVSAYLARSVAILERR